MKKLASMIALAVFSLGRAVFPLNVLAERGTEDGDCPLEDGDQVWYMGYYFT